MCFYALGIESNLNNHFIIHRMADVEELIDRALGIIINARRGLIDKDEALDALWEFLINIDYEVRTRYALINPST
ncbi:hypothetical protein JCM16161A_15750 [Vulcanisaeta sp. JCM 16161]